MGQAGFAADGAQGDLHAFISVFRLANTSYTFADFALLNSHGPTLRDNKWGMFRGTNKVGEKSEVELIEGAPWVFVFGLRLFLVWASAWPQVEVLTAAQTEALAGGAAEKADRENH